MGADTTMNKSKMGNLQTLKALKRLRAHEKTTGDLIDQRTRTPEEVALLFLAFQAFRENRLGGVVWTLQGKPTPEELNRACNMRVGQLALEDKDQKYLRQRGIKYVGELFYIFFDPKSRASVETGQRILGVFERQLGLPHDMDPLAEGWIPCYWGETFDRLINTLILELAPTPKIENWDAFVQLHSKTYFRRAHRGIGRRYHRQGINHVGQLLAVYGCTPGCPANSISAGKLIELRATFRELGSTIWAGAKIPLGYTFADCRTHPIWIAEESAIENEQPLLEAAMAQHDARKEAEREKRRQERKSQVLQKAREDAEAKVHECRAVKEKPSISVLLIRVDTLEMTVRLANRLQNAGLETVGQVLTKTEADFLRTKQFGRKSLGELKELLSEELACWLGFTPEKRMQLSDFAECNLRD
jgi:hypothetical protein